MELADGVLILLLIVAEDVSRAKRWRSVSVVCFDRICAAFSFSRNLLLDYCCASESSARTYRLTRGLSLAWSIDAAETPYSYDTLDSMCSRREHWNGCDSCEPETTTEYNRSHSVDHNLRNLSSRSDDNRWDRSKRIGSRNAEVLKSLTVFDRRFIFDVLEERSSDLYEWFCSRLIVLRTTSRTMGD